MTHATFSWNYSIVPGLDVYYLNLLQPDLYVTIADGILSIRARLTEERWQRLYTVNNLLWWRDVERASTEMMAAWQRKPHYLIGRRQGPETLHRLIFAPQTTTTYLSYPMTHLQGEELLARLEAFRQRLGQRVIVFDPAAVDDFTVDLDAPVGFSDGSVQAGDVGATLSSTKLEGDVPDGAGRGGAFGGVGGPASKTGRARDLILDARDGSDGGPPRPENAENLEHIDGQIVDRDYKLIEQSQTVVVYYPTTTLSAGVICEMKEAIHRGKRVYALWLPEQPPAPSSPATAPAGSGRRRPSSPTWTRPGSPRRRGNVPGPKSRAPGRPRRSGRARRRPAVSPGTPTPDPGPGPRDVIAPSAGGAGRPCGAARRTALRAPPRPARPWAGRLRCASGWRPPGPAPGRRPRPRPRC